MNGYIVLIVGLEGTVFIVYFFCICDLVKSFPFVHF